MASSGIRVDTVRVDVIGNAPASSSTSTAFFVNIPLPHVTIGSLTAIHIGQAIYRSKKIKPYTYDLEVLCPPSSSSSSSSAVSVLLNKKEMPLALYFKKEKLESSFCATSSCTVRMIPLKEPLLDIRLSDTNTSDAKRFEPVDRKSANVPEGGPRTYSVYLFLEDAAISTPPSPLLPPLRGASKEESVASVASSSSLESSSSSSSSDLAAALLLSRGLSLSPSVSPNPLRWLDAEKESAITRALLAGDLTLPSKRAAAPSSVRCARVFKEWCWELFDERVAPPAWVPLSPKTQEACEKSYNDRSCTGFGYSSRSANAKYTVNVRDMTRTNDGTGQARRIRRRDVRAAAAAQVVWEIERRASSSSSSSSWTTFGPSQLHEAVENAYSSVRADGFEADRRSGGRVRITLDDGNFTFTDLTTNNIQRLRRVYRVPDNGPSGDPFPSGDDAGAFTWVDRGYNVVESGGDPFRLRLAELYYSKDRRFRLASKLTKREALALQRRWNLTTLRQFDAIAKVFRRSSQKPPPLSPPEAEARNRYVRLARAFRPGDVVQVVDDAAFLEAVRSGSTKRAPKRLVPGQSLVVTRVRSDAEILVKEFVDGGVGVTNGSTTGGDETKERERALRESKEEDLTTTTSFLVHPVLLRFDARQSARANDHETPFVAEFGELRFPEILQMAPRRTTLTNDAIARMTVKRCLYLQQIPFEILRGSRRHGRSCVCDLVDAEERARGLRLKVAIEMMRDKGERNFAVLSSDIHDATSRAVVEHVLLIVEALERRGRLFNYLPGEFVHICGTRYDDDKGFFARLLGQHLPSLDVARFVEAVAPTFWSRFPASLRKVLDRKSDATERVSKSFRIIFGRCDDRRGGTHPSRRIQLREHLLDVFQNLQRSASSVVWDPALPFFDRFLDARREYLEPSKRRLVVLIFCLRHVTTSGRRTSLDTTACLKILFNFLASPPPLSSSSSVRIFKDAVVPTKTKRRLIDRVRRRFDAVKDDEIGSKAKLTPASTLVELRKASTDSARPLFRYYALCQLSNVDRWRCTSPLCSKEKRGSHRRAIMRASVAGRTYTKNASVRARRALERSLGYYRFDTRVLVDSRRGVFVATRRHDTRVLFGVQLDDDPAGVFVWMPRRALTICCSNAGAVKRRLEMNRTLQNGDRVRFTDDADEAKHVLRSSPGWADGMKGDLGKLGVVSDVSSRSRKGVVRVRFPSSGNQWWLRTPLLTRVSKEEAEKEETKNDDAEEEEEDDGVKLKVGAYVRVCDDQGTAQLVQGSCRAGWSDEMAPYCGRVGRISSEYAGEHIWRVQFSDDSSFAYSGAVLTRVAAPTTTDTVVTTTASTQESKETPNCSGRHGLQRFVTTHGGYSCDVCRRRRCPQGCVMYGCRVCNYDACVACFEGSDDSTTVKRGCRVRFTADRENAERVMNSHPATWSERMAAFCGKMGTVESVDESSVRVQFTQPQKRSWMIAKSLVNIVKNAKLKPAIPLGARVRIENDDDSETFEKAQRDAGCLDTSLKHRGNVGVVLGWHKPYCDAYDVFVLGGGRRRDHDRGRRGATEGNVVRFARSRIRSIEGAELGTESVGGKMVDSDEEDGDGGNATSRVLRDDPLALLLPGDVVTTIVSAANAKRRLEGVSGLHWSSSMRTLFAEAKDATSRQQRRCVVTGVKGPNVVRVAAEGCGTKGCVLRSMLVRRGKPPSPSERIVNLARVRNAKRYPEFGRSFLFETRAATCSLLLDERHTIFSVTFPRIVRACACLVEDAHQPCTSGSEALERFVRLNPKLERVVDGSIAARLIAGERDDSPSGPLVYRALAALIDGRQKWGTFVSAVRRDITIVCLSPRYRRLISFVACAADEMERAGRFTSSVPSFRQACAKMSRTLRKIVRCVVDGSLCTSRYSLMCTFRDADPANSDATELNDRILPSLMSEKGLEIQDACHQMCRGEENMLRLVENLDDWSAFVVERLRISVVRAKQGVSSMAKESNAADGDDPSDVVRTTKDARDQSRDMHSSDDDDDGGGGDGDESDDGGDGEGGEDEDRERGRMRERISRLVESSGGLSGLDSDLMRELLSFTSD